MGLSSFRNSVSFKTNTNVLSHFGSSGEMKTNTAALQSSLCLMLTDQQLDLSLEGTKQFQQSKVVKCPLVVVCAPPPSTHSSFKLSVS